MYLVFVGLSGALILIFLYGLTILENGIKQLMEESKRINRLRAVLDKQYAKRVDPNHDTTKDAEC